MDILCALFLACLSLQAPTDPPAIPADSIAYSEHSSLLEYVAATNYVADDSDAAVLAAWADKPFEGYWLDDPIRTAAAIDEYKVGTVTLPRPAARKIGSAAALRHSYAKAGSSAAIPPARKAGRKPLIHRSGPGPRGARQEQALVQAKDWW
jgi:hypothetical protein